MAQRGITDDTSILPLSSLQESFFNDFFLPGFTIPALLTTTDPFSIEAT
jgi:hypothetical protein